MSHIWKLLTVANNSVGTSTNLLKWRRQPFYHSPSPSLDRKQSSVKNSYALERRARVL